MRGSESNEREGGGKGTGDAEFLSVEAARDVTGHGSNESFLRWAKKHAPGILVRFKGMRQWQVDRGALMRTRENADTERFVQTPPHSRDCET